MERANHIFGEQVMNRILLGMLLVVFSDRWFRWQLQYS